MNPFDAIVTLWSYVAVVFAVLPPVAPFPLYATVYVFAVNVAVICLGAVIRGATSHYDYVCSEVSKGIANVSLASDIPVMFGVLTTDTIEQAIERAGTKAGNKGFECAEGAIEMVNLIKEIEG